MRPLGCEIQGGTSLASHSPVLVEPIASLCHVVSDTRMLVTLTHENVPGTIVYVADCSNVV